MWYNIIPPIINPTIKPINKQVFIVFWYSTVPIVKYFFMLPFCTVIYLSNSDN